MPERLAGKVALITGGSKGIGSGIAEIFIKEGSKVVICSRSKEAIDKMTGQIKATGGDITGILCDVTDKSQVKDLILETIKAYGKLDILVNNAGQKPGKPITIEDLTEKDWDEYMAINAKGTWLASKYAIPELKKAGGGSIIMISSISAHIGQPLTGSYNSTKAAQEGLVRSMALDFGKDNIRVNAICPAWIMTEETGEKMSPEIAKLYPISRIGTVYDVAWAAVYLASDESSWVTGASLAVDGGYMAI